MKKKFLVVGLCLIMTMSLALAACLIQDDAQTGALKSANDVYGLGAVSTVKLLGSNISASAVKTFSAVNEIALASSDNSEPSSGDAVSAEDEAKGQAEKFNEYFTALDSFLGEEIVSTSVVENTDSKYEYEKKMIVNGKDFNGETKTYTMYYTETLVTDKNAEEDDEDYDDDEEDDEDEDEIMETEREYRLVGVMVIDGTEYYLEGERSEENEKDETETELKIRAYADKTDKTSYIQMEQEYSVEEGETETEYVYSIYAGGELIEQTAVEFERENKNNKVETEYEIEFRSGNAKGRYSVEREVKDDKTQIKVKYDIDGKTGVFHIREITDENGSKKYEYTFSDSEKIVF